MSETPDRRILSDDEQRHADEAEHRDEAALAQLAITRAEEKRKLGSGRLEVRKGETLHEAIKRHRAHGPNEARQWVRRLVDAFHDDAITAVEYWDLCDAANQWLAGAPTTGADDRDMAHVAAALIGYPPEGSHPDEWMPRAETWHRERQNWQAEVERLRQEIARPDAGSVLYIRCLDHRNVPQINANEITGAECGACIQRDGALDRRATPYEEIENVARNYVPENNADGACGDALNLLSLDDRMALVRAGIALVASRAAS